MAGSIRLSPKHGLNPTLPICFFCGEEKGEIALMGYMNPDKKRGKYAEDVEAPKHMILDYEPCDKCKEAMSKGITMIGVSKSAPDGRPQIAHGMYPTGAWCVVSEDFIRRTISDSELAEDIIKKGKTIADNEIVMGLINQSKN